MKQALTFFLIFLTFQVFSQDDYDLARKHFSENNIDSARYYVNRELGKKPGAEDYFLSGMIHEAEKMELRALADYEAVVQKDPTNIEAYFQKGLIYYNSASSEKAIQDFSYVIDNYKNSNTKAIYFAEDPYGSKGTFVTSLQSMLAQVYQYRGLAYKKTGNTAQALVDFNKSFEFETTADFFINRSLLYSQLDQNELAISDLKASISLDSTNYLAWYNLALLDNEVRLPSELLNDDEFAPMLNLMGANAIEIGEYPLAISYLTKAIEVNSEDELAYLNRGKALLKTKAFKQARADFLKALQINSTNAEVFYLIGNSFFYESNFKDAVGFYEQYLSLDQGYKNVWYNAAMAYLSIKDASSAEDVKRACVCLQHAKKLGMEAANIPLDRHCDSQ